MSKPLLLAQAGRDALINYEFILEAPWKACRLCGAVYQSPLDRLAYEQLQDGIVPLCYATEMDARAVREEWLSQHNYERHPNFFHELSQLEKSGLPVTPEAAAKLSTYGIIYMGMTPYEDEINQAMFEAPRAPADSAD